MKKFIAMVLAVLGVAAAGAASAACITFVIDEPTMPKSML